MFRLFFCNTSCPSGLNSSMVMKLKIRKLHVYYDYANCFSAKPVCWGHSLFPARLRDILCTSPRRVLLARRLSRFSLVFTFRHKLLSHPLSYQPLLFCERPHSCPQPSIPLFTAGALHGRLPSCPFTVNVCGFHPTRRFLFSQPQAWKCICFQTYFRRLTGAWYENEMKENSEIKCFQSK